jgi:hypothetical protein
VTQIARHTVSRNIVRYGNPPCHARHWRAGGLVWGILSRVWCAGLVVCEAGAASWLEVWTFVGQLSVKIDQFGNGGGARGASAAMASVGAGRAAGQTAARKGRDGGMEDQEALDLAADWADISQG